MSIAPDIPAFIAAQDQLRQNFGSPVLFAIPQDPQWPAGTRINPDTGRPYSPMVQRTNAEFVNITKTALVILKQGSPLRPQADTHWEEVGLLSGMDIILDVGAADYPELEPTTEFELNGRRYSVEEWKPFSLAGQTYRYLLYGMEK